MAYYVPGIALSIFEKLPVAVVNSLNNLHSPFTDGKIEAQRGYVLCLRSPDNKWRSWNTTVAVYLKSGFLSAMRYCLFEQ